MLVRQAKENMMHNLWSVREVSKLVGVNARTIRRWCEYGLDYYSKYYSISPHVQWTGVQWIIPWKEVKRLINNPKSILAVWNKKHQ